MLNTTVLNFEWNNLLLLANLQYSDQVVVIEWVKDIFGKRLGLQLESNLFGSQEDIAVWQLFVWL